MSAAETVHLFADVFTAGSDGSGVESGDKLITLEPTDDGRLDLSVLLLDVRELAVLECHQRLDGAAVRSRLVEFLETNTMNLI